MVLNTCKSALKTILAIEAGAPFLLSGSGWAREIDDLPDGSERPPHFSSPKNEAQSHREVLAGGLLCLALALMLFTWLIEPVLESALRASK